MLKRVKIQGYKSLEDVEVHLQPLSVLFGPNASGKSNFLDALQLLSRIATSRTLKEAFAPLRGTPLESFTFDLEGVKSLRRKNRVFFSMEVDIELSTDVIDRINNRYQLLSTSAEKMGKSNEEKAEAKKHETPSSLIYERYLRYYIQIEMQPSLSTLRVVKESLVALDRNGKSKQSWPLLNYEDTENAFYMSVFLGNDETLYQPYHNLDHSLLNDPLLPFVSPYLFAMREELGNWFFLYLEPRERMRLPSSVKDIRRIGAMGEDLPAFLNTLQHLDKVQFRAIEKALHMIVPSITGLKVDVNDFGEVELMFLEGQTPISSRLVSDGTLRVLGLLALSGVKESPTLLGFEEPENGIHPRRLRLIASLLRTRARHTQVIATTHSSILPDLIPHNSLYVCRKRDGHTLIEPFSVWEYPDLGIVLDDEEETLPELTVSERILRGDFDA